MPEKSLAGELDPEVLVLPSESHDITSQLLREGIHDKLCVTALEQVLE